MSSMRTQQLLTLICCSLLVVGCTSKEEPSAAAPAEPPPKAEAPPAAEAEAPPSQMVVLIGNDSMQYNTNEIRVKSGGTVTVNLTHSGQLPVEAMGHNFVLLKQGTDMAAFATKALSAKENGYIPEGDEYIAHTKLVGGGESTSVTFDTPEPGEYTFLCTFPGHYGVMNGKFIVES